MNTETTILKDRLEQIRNTLLELECIKQDIQRLISSNEEHRQNSKSESTFFARLYLNYTRLFVIDIYKLVGKKEDHNIQRVLNFCKTNIKRIDWYNSVSLKELNRLGEKLDDISDRIDKIEGLRNKFYAHNDKNKRNFSFKMSLSDLWEILEGVQEIFTYINAKFDNHHWLFNIQYISPPILQNISKFNQIGKLTLNKDREISRLIETDQLRAIIRKR